MATKYFLLALVVASTNAGLLHHHGVSPIYHHTGQSLPIGHSFSYHNEPTIHHSEVPHVVHEEPSAPAQYDYNYSVADPATGNYQDKYEVGNGDHVNGRYSLIEPDGQRRTVTYTVSGDSGFIATVTREPSGIQVPVQNSIAPQTGFWPPLHHPVPPHHPAPPHIPSPPLPPSPPSVPLPPSHDDGYHYEPPSIPFPPLPLPPQPLPPVPQPLPPAPLPPAPLPPQEYGPPPSL